MGENWFEKLGQNVDEKMFAIDNFIVLGNQFCCSSINC